MISSETLKLNLGARETIVPGFVNIDIDPHPGIDYVGDVSDLRRFGDESVTEILASHILEHFPHTKTIKVLKEWHRVLVKNGILYVAVPDFRRTIDLYKMHGLTDWVVNFLWGDQGYKTAFHYTGFDYSRLHDMLKNVGFSEISQVDQFGIIDDDCSDKISTYDGRSVSLNVVAIK